MTEYTASRPIHNTLITLIISGLHSLKATRERTSQSHNMCVEARRRAKFSPKQSFMPLPKHKNPCIFTPFYYAEKRK